MVMCGILEVIYNVTAWGDVWNIRGDSVVFFSNNTVDRCNIKVQQERSFVSLDASVINVQDNKLFDIEGHAIIKIGRHVDQINLMQNSIINATVQFYIATVLPYADVANWIMHINQIFGLPLLLKS